VEEIERERHDDKEHGDLCDPAAVLVCDEREYVKQEAADEANHRTLRKPLRQPRGMGGDNHQESACGGAELVESRKQDNERDN
jgi:hypothetical protein